MWQIAMRDYKFGKGKHKSLTKATYTAIGDHFRELWGDEAGWAHSVSPHDAKHGNWQEFKTDLILGLGALYGGPEGICGEGSKDQKICHYHYGDYDCEGEESEG